MAYKSYREVRDMYDVLADAGVVTESLPDWSRKMNQVTGTEEYSEGTADNWIKQASVGVDRLLEMTGAPQAAGELGAAVGGWVGDEESGREIGESLPRTAASMLPFLIPGVGPVAGTASMAALGGAEAYTKTGSVASGLTAAALNAVMPGAANLAEQAVLKRVGGKLVQGPLIQDGVTKAFKQYYATSLPQGLAAYAGGQAAGAGIGVASDIGQQVLSGDEVNISPTEQLLNLTLGQLPFAAVHLTKGGRVPFGGAATRDHVAKIEEGIQRSKDTIQIRQMQEALDEHRNKSTLEDVPDYELDVQPPSPVDVAQKNFLINKLRQQQRDNQTEGTPLALDEWHKSVDEVNKIVRETGLVEGNIRGAKVDNKTERFPLIAKEVIHRPETGWRMVIAADDPRNGEYAGKKVDWSTLHEPEATESDVEGHLVYSVPKGYHDTKPPSPGWIDRQTRKAEGLPELPIQPNEIVDANSEIRIVEEKVRSAKSDTDFHDAVVKLNGVRQAYGWRALDDVEIEARRKMWQLGSEKDAFRNAIEETKRLVQARDSARVESELNRERELAKKERDDANDKLDVTAQEIAQKKLDEIDSQMVDLSPKARRDREDVHFAKVMEDAKGGPTVLPERAAQASDVVDLYNTFSQSGKTRYNEITTSGLWEKKLLEWHQEGTGDIEQLKAKFADAIASGAGLKGRIQKASPEMLPPGPESMAEPVKKAVDTPKKAETEPVKNVVYENAIKVTEGTPHTNDREMFLELVQKGQHEFQAAYKMNEDAYNDWASQDHVREWTFDLTDIAEGNMAPNSVNRPRMRSRDFVPKSALEKDFVNKVGTDGVSLLGRLKASHDPIVMQLATDLEKFGDALKRVSVRVKDMTLNSHALRQPDGRVQINLNKDLIRSSSSAQDVDMMHELLHGLSQHELRNPLNAKHVTAFTALRLRMAELLPKDLRAAFDKLNVVDGDGFDWYGRYSRGKGDWKELGNAVGGNNDHAHILYGLLNNDEFLTQGFTAKPLREYLKSQKGADGETYFHKFVNWISDLVGLKLRGTAMEEFLGHADKILDAGNYVSSVHNFGERYLTGKGYGVEQARELTSHAVGLLRDVKYNPLTQSYIVEKLGQSVFSDATRFAEAEVNKVFETDPTSTMGLLGEHDYEPNIAGLDVLSRDLITGRVDSKILDLLDPKVADYIYSKARDIEAPLDMLRAATDKDNKGLLNLDADAARAPVIGTLNELQKILDLERKFAITTAEMQGLVKVSPAGYMEEVISNPAPKGLYADPDTPPQKQIGIFASIFGTPTKFSKDSPEFAELTSKAHQLLSNKHQMETTALRPLVAKIDPVTGEETIYDKKAKELSDPTVEKAVNKWMHQNQEQGKETGVVMLTKDTPEIQKILAGVPEGKRQAVIDKVEGQVLSTQIAQKQTLEKMADVSVIDAAALIASATKKPAVQNVKIADAAYRAMSMDSNDPAQAAQQRALLDNVQRTVGDVSTFNTLLQFLQNQREVIKMHEEHFAANPAWATAQRFGKFELEYRKGGKVYFDKVNSRKEAEQKVAELGGQITRFERTAETDDTAAAIFNNRDTPRQLARLRELEANKYEMLSQIYPPEVIDDMKRASAVEQYAVEAAYAGGVKNVKTHERRLSKGAEELSWLNNHVNWVGQNASHWTREKFKSQSRLILSQPALQERPDLLNKARQYVSQMLSADPEVGKVATRVTSTWLLGFNPASAIVNGTQLLTRGAAELTNITGKPLQSYKRILNTYREMVDYALGKGWAGPDHEWVVKQMHDEGVMSASIFEEGTMQNEKTATNLKRAIAKNRPQSLGQWLGTLAGQYSHLGMLSFKAMERVNNTGAVLSAFDIYRERGLTREAAYAKALETNRTINDVGGKANRPIGLFAGTDKFSRSSAMIGTSMQSYMLGSLFQLGNYLNRGAFGGSSLTPHEKWNARKAAGQMLLVQFGAAGALGLPGVAGILATLDQAFPNLELGKHLREGIHGLISQFLTEDEENGRILGDMAMTGVPSMFGWDWQSRLSMGALPGVSEINGVQPGLLMGSAPYSAVSQFVKGVGSVAQGDYAKAANLFPPGVKKVVDLAMDGFKARDYNGKPILDLTPGETVGVALGFTPKSVKNFNDANRMAGRAEKLQDAEKSKFNNSMVNEVEKGNFGTIQQKLNERARLDPTFDPQASGRAIARAAVEMQFPRDLRRERRDSKLLKMFNIPASMPSEMARKQYEVMVLQRLGVSVRPRDLQKAAIMDQLRAQNPDASRYDLGREAERLMGKQKQQAMLPEPTAAL